MTATLTPAQQEQLRTDAYDEERPWVTEPTEAERAIEEDEFYRQFGFSAKDIERGDREYDARTGN